MFRKPTKKRGQMPSRQAQEIHSSEDDNEDTVKDVVKRKKRNNPMIQSTMKKSRANEQLSSDSSDGTEDVVVAEHAFAASGSAAPLGPRDQGATATLDIDTDTTADAQAQFERVQKQLKEGLEKDGKTLYKGAAMYGAKEAKDTAKGNASSGANRFGPVRAPGFLRQTVRWDYAPDICKDYKETGFCTFGDSCKFLHDRSDYQHGWEIERDFAAGKYDKDDTNYEIDDDDDKFPELCFICNQEFTKPIITICKHYFCEKCAYAEYKKSKKCPICFKSTDGIFNPARELRAKLAGIQSRRDKVKEEEREKAKIEEDEDEEGAQEATTSAEAEDQEDVKQEVEDEEGSEGSEGDQEEGEEGQNDDVNNEEPQEEQDIKMEEIEDDGDNSEDVDDEGDEEEEEEDK